VIGWCWAGCDPFAAADLAIRALRMYYGAASPIPPRSGKHRPRSSEISAARQGAEPDQVKTFEAALRKAGKKVDFKIFPQANHAFANDQSCGSFREVDGSTPEVTLVFLDRELKKASRPRAGNRRATDGGALRQPRTCDPPPRGRRGDHLERSEVLTLAAGPRPSGGRWNSEAAARARYTEQCLKRRC
jgi:hypothetical protein